MKENLPEYVIHNFFEEYAASLIAFTKSRCKNEQEAEEILSDTKLKAILKYDQLKKQESLKSWIFKILTNNIYQLHRDLNKKKQLETVSFSEISENATIEKAIYSKSIKDSDDDEKEKEKSRTLELIFNHAQHFTDRQRKILVYKYVNGYKGREIAEKMNTSIGDIKKESHRIVQKLKEIKQNITH